MFHLEKDVLIMKVSLIAAFDQNRVRLLFSCI